MPRLVADQQPWHASAAMVCVGPGEYPRALEWELRSGAANSRIDFAQWLGYQRLTPNKTGEGDRTSSFCHPVSFVRKFGGEQKKTRPLSHSATDITSERANHFGTSAPGSSPPKTGTPTRIGAAAFTLNGKLLGLLTCVSGPLRTLRSWNPALCTRPRLGTAQSGAKSGAIESE
jgi:hypothetical protein